jgi:ELWxxDGT repeat protein
MRSIVRRRVLLSLGLAGLFALPALLAGPASAQPAVRVADVNPSQEEPANPQFLAASFAAVGSTVYFSADDGILGLEVWKSDGSAAGTVLVKDTCPGSCWSFPRLFTASGGRLFFIADDGSHGRELWVTDGTPAGTQMVKDIAPGLASGAGLTVQMVDVDGVVYFNADDGIHGDELWKSDGTAAGTQLVADIVAGTGGSAPVVRTRLGSGVFFTADDGSHGREPWASDGSTAGTGMLGDLNPGTSSSSFSLSFSSFTRNWLTLSNGKVIFLANDGTHGLEPWLTDGTVAGTTMVADIKPGADGSVARDFAEMAGMIYFSAEAGIGSELWKTDGTPGNTSQVKDINPAGGSGPFELTVVGNTLFFRAFDADHGIELWKSDGTEAGTVLVKDITPGPDTSFFPGALNGFTALGGQILFWAFDGTNAELWKSDGTEAGTVQVTHLSPDVVPSFLVADTGFVAVGGALYYRAFEPGGMELWKTDGTEAGTGQIKDINLQTPSLFLFNGMPVGGERWLAPVPGGGLLFQATDGATGFELWKTDGSPAGTSQVADLIAGSESSFPAEITRLGTGFAFTARGVLWTTDGTPGGTTPLGEDANLDRFLTAFGSLGFFSRQSVTAGQELWQTDGTEAGTAIVKNIRPAQESSNPAQLTVSGDWLFFTAADGANPEGVPDTEIWKTDGTEAGTVRVKDVRTGIESSDPDRLTDAGGHLFFFALTDAAGRELWKSDGTEAGTFLVKDIRPGAESSSQPFFGIGESFTAAIGRTFYFVADDGASGPELWKSDGTEAGTVLVKDIFPGARGAEPALLTRVRNRLFFVADDGTHGRELWTSDGTEAGTVLVADLVPGEGSSLPQQLAAMGHLLLFSAWDETHGREPWKSDGTAAGTVRIQDIAPGALSSSPVQFTSSFPNVYFGANDGTSGFEPWVLPRTALGSTFGDVPADFWAFPWIEALVDAGITGGCGTGNYCPDRPVTRAESAVFLVRAVHGPFFIPSLPSEPGFDDVPIDHWAARWIKMLVEDGVTGGCGDGNYCPDRAVTRAELAVFLVRARLGTLPLPAPGPEPVFGDVPADYWARNWIEFLFNFGITGGCGNGNFCPERPVTRAELAVLLSRLFNLPTP